MPEGVVVHEPSRRVPVRLLHGDVIDVGATSFDRNDFVVPLLLFEPTPLAHVCLERLLLARETKADLGRETRSRRGYQVDVPAAVLLGPAPGEYPVIQEEQRDLARELLTRRAQDDAVAAGVSIAIEVSAKERPDDRLGRSENGFGHVLLARARPVGEPERLNEKIREVLGVKKNANFALFFADARGQAEQLPRKAREFLCLGRVARREPQVSLDATDVPVAHEVPQKRAELGGDVRRRSERRPLVHGLGQALVLGSLVREKCRIDGGPASNGAPGSVPKHRPERYTRFVSDFFEVHPSKRRPLDRDLFLCKKPGPTADRDSPAPRQRN